MRKVLCIITVFSVMVALLVFPSFASDLSPEIMNQLISADELPDPGDSYVGQYYYVDRKVYTCSAVEVGEAVDLVVGYTFNDTPITWDNYYSYADFYAITGNNPDSYVKTLSAWGTQYVLLSLSDGYYLCLGNSGLNLYQITGNSVSSKGSVAFSKVNEIAIPNGLTIEAIPTDTIFLDYFKAGRSETVYEWKMIYEFPIPGRGIRSERLQNYVDAVEKGTCTPMRHTMTESFSEVFSSVLPAMAAVALWISACITADLIVFLVVLALLYFIVGGKRRVKDE